MKAFARGALLAIKLVLGVCVSPEEELEGLDIGEHGSPAYPDFAIHGSSAMGVPMAAAGATPAGARTPARVEA